MKEEQYKMLRNVITIIVGVTFAVAISVNSYILAISSFLVGLSVLILLRRQAKIVVSDERAKLIGDKAARMAFVTFTIISALIGNLILLLAKPEDYFIRALGNMFSYIAVFLLFVYAASYWLYSREYGA